MTLLDQLDLSDALGPLDWAVFMGVIALTVAAVIYGHRRKEGAPADDKEGDLLDYLVMGRRLTFPLFTATLVATWYGGIFGVTELAFTTGVYNFLTQGVFWYATYLVFAFVLVPRISAYEAVTLPELVGKMFGPRSAVVAALFNVFNVLPVAYAISAGLLAQMIFGGPLWINMAAATALVCLYTLWGGLRGVVYSDLIQFFVMVSGVALVVVYAASHLGGWAYLTAQLPPGHFEPMGGHSLGTTLVWGFIALATLVDPNFYQRCFAAQSTQTARRGIIAATVIWFVFDMCTTLGGMYAAASIPTADSRHAYLIMAVQVLPDGLRGFFLAGIAATILSTLDSFTFVAANTLSYDLAPEGLKGSRWLRRGAVALVGAVAVSVGLLFDGHLKDVWMVLGSYSAGCLLIPMMAGHLWPGRIPDRAFVVATVSGAVMITVWRFTEGLGLGWEVDPLYIGAAVTSAALAIGAAARAPA